MVLENPLSGVIICEICGDPIYYDDAFRRTNEVSVFKKHRHIFCDLYRSSTPLQRSDETPSTNQTAKRDVET